jgi:2-dehydro-3-deoxygluconokinase
MADSSEILRRMQETRLIALLTPDNPEACIKAYEITEPEGILLEIAFRSAAALPGIRAIREAHPDALVLAGTVLSQEQARLAIEAGAAGVVSADYFPEVVEECVRRDIMCIPGGLADAGKQLAQKAALYGCTLEELRTKHPHQWVYKLFPAFSGTHSYVGLVNAWRGPYKGLAVVYTGGINRATLNSAAAHDPQGIFCASALTINLERPELMRNDIREWRRALGPPPPPSPEAEPVDAGTVEPKSGPSSEPVVTFGELMLRLSAPPGRRLRNAVGFEVNFGGAEANVASSLAGWARPVRFVTALPAGDLGDNALAALKARGVDTACMRRKDSRMGLYFLEHGSGVRPSKVIYDRARSAITQVSGADFDWEAILKDAVWFHWTGITPALGPGPAEALEEGLKAARALGVRVSVDLNYRAKLWGESEAREVMGRLMPYVDICIGNEEDPARIFGIQAAHSDVERGELDAEGYRTLTAELREKFGFDKVAVTLRESLSASENRWSACLYNGEEFLLSPRYRVPIIDRVGTGDAFAAGVIHSLLNGGSDQTALDFGVAAAAWKHSLYGDFNLAHEDEIERLAAGERSGRIRR